MQNIIAISLFLTLFTSLFLSAQKMDINLTTKINILENKLLKNDKKLKRLTQKVNKIKAHEANDNIKFGIDFRNSYNYINYKYNDYTKPDGTELDGTSESNKALYTQKLYLTMVAKPHPLVSFRGKFGFYKTWGGNQLSGDKSVKDWQKTAKPNDSVFRIKEAYFLYTSDPYNGNFAFSIGRRPSSTGFLANHREGDKKPNSPLAHVTNMEVDAAMVKFGLSNIINLPGSYIKFVYGKAHNAVYEINDFTYYAPYSLQTAKDDDVTFIVLPMSIYNDGRFKLMAQHSIIIDTKGKKIDTATIKKASGYSYLNALSLEVNGLSDDLGYLSKVKTFISVASTQYNPKDGYSLLGSTEKQTGTSVWLGLILPDGLTKTGKIGFEYNRGSKYWTPITWAEDTLIGSKIAVRGNAYEVYYNTKLFGMKHLSAELRYTRINHQYTPNIRCSGWVAPESVDIEADNLRFTIRYQY